MMRRTVPAALLLTLLTAAPAAAQRHVGIRAGASADPGQFYFGAHAETRPLIENLTFRPNLEVGVGNDLTLFALNVEFAYWIPVQNKPVSVYLGAGPSAVIVSRDRGRNGDGTDAGGGFNVLVGFQHRAGLFAELKVGVADSPNLKVGVGFAFR